MGDNRQAIIQAGRIFYGKGWMEGTGGNLSARHDDLSFWITASGKHKGELQEKDFVRVDLDGDIVVRGEEGSRPSAETSIHQVLYKHDPSIGAVYHVHSVEANLVSCMTPNRELRLAPLEVLKGFGIWRETPKVTIPLFENHLDVPKIAEEFSRWLGTGGGDIPAMLIRCHGVTVWGRDPSVVRNYVELIEFIFRYMVEERRLRLGV